MFFLHSLDPKDRRIHITNDNGQETFVLVVLCIYAASTDDRAGVQCCISVDIDAVAGWLGSYGGQDSTSDISRGLFAGTIGVRRMLKLFDKYNIKTTFFIPGHSLETFPDECKMIVDAGHEIGLHGYSHENPRDMTLEQQTAVLDKVVPVIR